MMGAATATASPSLVQPVSQRKATKPKSEQRGSKRIAMRQAENMVEAVAFSKMIGLPLVAHLTVHWACTDVGDDPDGKLFAKVREGLDKWARRHGFPLTCIWARERMSGGQSDVEHCHLLFHLPVEYRTGARPPQVEAAIDRIVQRHGRGILHENAVYLRVHPNPDGKYLIKGGGPKVWKLFRLRKEHRRLQGIIHGKRCGTTENIGLAARRCWNERQVSGWLEQPSEAA
jgi:hypothetical protein